VTGESAKIADIGRVKKDFLNLERYLWVVVVAPVSHSPLGKYKDKEKKREIERERGSQRLNL
jgi:hypothetical protein